MLFAKKRVMLMRCDDMLPLRLAIITSFDKATQDKHCTPCTYGGCPKPTGIQNFPLKVPCKSGFSGMTRLVRFCNTWLIGKNKFWSLRQKFKT